MSPEDDRQSSLDAFRDDIFEEMDKGTEDGNEDKVEEADTDTSTGAETE